MKRFIVVTIALNYFCFTALSQLVPSREGDSWFLVNEKTEEKVISEDFLKVEPLGTRFFIATHKNNMKSLISSDGKKLTSAEYVDFNLIGTKFISFSKTGSISTIQGEVVGGKWGLMDYQGKVVLAPKYHQIQYGSENYLIVQMDENWGNWGVIDYQGNWIEKAIYPSKSFDMRPHATITMADASKIVIEKSPKTWVIKDLKSKKSNTLTYSDIWGPWFVDGIAIIYSEKNENNSYVINSDGKMIIPSGIASFSQTTGNYLIGEDKNKQIVYLYTKQGKKVAQWNAEMLNYFQDGYGALRLKDEFVIFDSTGKITYKTKNKLSALNHNSYFLEEDEAKNYTLIQATSGKRFNVPKGATPEGVIPALNHVILTENIGTSSRKTGVFDFIQQKEVLNSKFWDIRHWQNGIYRVSFSYGEHAYVNALSGKHYFSLKDEYKIYSFRGEYELQHKYTGQNVFGRTFKEIQAVYWSGDSIFISKENGKVRLLHARKKKISEEYDNIDVKFNHYIVRRNNLVGVLNYQLETVVPTQYKDVVILAETLKNPVIENAILVSGEKKKGLFSLTGKMIADTIYTQIYVNRDFYQCNKGTSFVQKTFSFYDKTGKYVPALEGASSVREQYNSSWSVVYFSEKNQMLFDLNTNKTLELPKDILFERIVDPSMKTMHFYFKKGKKYGIMDENGKVILNAKDYDFISPTDSPLEFLSNKSSSMVIKSENEKLNLKSEAKISITQYTLMNYASEFEKKWRYSLLAGKEVKLVDEQLNQIGTETYKLLYAGEHFIIAFNKQGKAGAIDQKGKIIIPFEYDSHEFIDVWGYEAFVKDKKYFLYNEDGKLCFSNLSIDSFPYYDFMDDEKTVVVKSNNKFILLEKESEKVILDNILDIIYDEELYYTHSEAFPDGEKLLLVKQESGTGLYSFSLKSFIVQPQFTEIKLLHHYDSESIFLLTRNEKGFNLFDPKSKQFAFEQEAEEFLSSEKENSVFAFLVKGKIHLVHKLFDNQKFKIVPTAFGKEKLTFEYNIDLLVNDHEVLDGINILKGKKKGMILMNGTLLHPPTLDYFEPEVIGGNYLLVKKEGKRYIIDLKGNYVFQEGFDFIEFMLDGNLLAIGTIKSGKKYVEVELYSDGTSKVKKD